MATQEARFFHCTLYRFDQEAREAVIADFNATVQDVQSRCWYDVENAMFSLICPSQGCAQVNEVFNSILSKYMENQLIQAETSDHIPTINRFVESSFEDLRSSTLQPTEPTNPPTTTDAIPHAFVLHSVLAEEPANIKFFILRELPGRFLGRVLIADDRRSKKTVTSKVTCRTVTWSAAREEYVFDSCVGKQVTMVTSATEELFRATTFTHITGTSHVDENARGIVNRSTHFNFTREAPSVQQFIEGMGDIEPEGPDYMPEVPRDAARFQRQQDVFIPGRARIPRQDHTPPISDSDSKSEESEESDDSEDSAPNQNSFMESLRRTHGEQNDASTQPRPLTAQSIIPTLNPTDQDLTAGTVVPRSSNASGPSNTGRGFVEQCTARVQSDFSEPHTDYFPDNSNFARIDGRGLTSIAANQARWVHENPSPRRKGGSCRGVARRDLVQAPTTGPSNVNSRFHTQDPGQYVEDCDASTLWGAPLSVGTKRSIPEWSHKSLNKGGDGTWSNRTNRPIPSSPKLVDDSAPRAGPASKLPPPGFDYQDRTAAFEALQSDPLELLIDLHDDSMTGAIAQPTPMENRGTVGGDEHIVERLKVVDDGAHMKKNTMRQKARGKSKSRNHSAKAKSHAIQAKVTLSMPDPPPVPKGAHKEANNQPAHDISVTRTHSFPRVGEDSSDVVPARNNAEKSGKKARDVPEDTLVGVEKLVEALSSKDGLEGAEISIHFGMILNKCVGEKVVLGRVQIATAVERNLNGAGASLETEFLARLTTSDKDAAFMLQLHGDDEISAAVEYEIEIKNAEGRSRLLKFNQADPNDFILLSIHELGTAYLHYPGHVWDAKVNIKKSKADTQLMDAVRSFISSIATAETAPSIRALVPSRSFSVETVHAKRCFSKKVNQSVELRVTERQELLIESINDYHFNFQATALSRDMMVANHHLWWECALHTTTTDLATANALQQVTNSLISSMDGVGLENKGPFVRGEIDGPVVRAIPFW